MLARGARSFLPFRFTLRERAHAQARRDQCDDCDCPFHGFPLMRGETPTILIELPVGSLLFRSDRSRLYVRDFADRESFRQNRTGAQAASSERKGKERWGWRVSSR